MKVLFLTILLLIANISCSRSAISSASVPATSIGTVSVPTTPFIETADDDRAVFTTVLTHFAKQDIAGNASAEGVKKVIVIDSKSCGPSGFLSQAQLDGEFHNEGWKRLAELSIRIRERNGQASPVTDLIRGENLVVDDLSKLPKGMEFSDAFEKKYPEAIRYINLWLPAYSPDGTHVLVRFSFGPTAHGAIATYMLVKENGVWTVKHHKIAYYL